MNFVPDVDAFTLDGETGVMVREGLRLVMNPDDVCAVAFALRVKATHPETSVEVVTMAPVTVTPHMEDLIRVGVDKGTILADPAFAGSDTYATATVLARHLARCDFDVILTGTHAIDGDTAHVPAQLGACLALSRMSGIVRVDENRFTHESAVFDVESEDEVATYAMVLPGILSLTRDSGYKLPYPSRKALERDVSSQLQIVSNRELAFAEGQVGLGGSRTQVVKAFARKNTHKDQIVVQADDEGIAFIHQYLRDKGFL